MCEVHEQSRAVEVEALAGNSSSRVLPSTSALAYISRTNLLQGSKKMVVAVLALSLRRAT